MAPTKTKPSWQPLELSKRVYRSNCSIAKISTSKIVGATKSGFGFALKEAILAI